MVNLSFLMRDINKLAFSLYKILYYFYNIILEFSSLGSCSTTNTISHAHPLPLITSFVLK